MSIICSFIPSIFLLSTSHKSWVKIADLTNTKDEQVEHSLLVYHLHASKLRCLCSCSAKSSTEFIFVHRSTEMSFLSVKADARSKKHTCSSVTPTSLLNVS